MVYNTTKAAAAPSMLIVNQKTPRIYRVEESKCEYIYQYGMTLA